MPSQPNGPKKREITYLFYSQYGQHGGIFTAATPEEAVIYAWDSLRQVLPNANPKQLAVAPMTQEQADSFPDQAFLARLQPYQIFSPYAASRPPTKIETEAITAIIEKGDELAEAKRIIKLLLRNNSHARETALAFLRPKPLRIVADGDE